MVRAQCNGAQVRLAMFRAISDAMMDNDTELRHKLAGIYTLLIAVNLFAGTWAWLAFGSHPLLLGMAALAYGFGARHAVDADHIAAIDNVTRKLMQNGYRPVAVGFYFSLGHSGMVALATAVTIGDAAVLRERFDGFRDLGSIFGIGISATFLLVIATETPIVLVQIYRRFDQ